MSFVKVDMKTDGVRSLVFFVGGIFIVALTIIIFGFSQVDSLSLNEKIEYATKALTSTAIAFGGLAVSVNAYYTARLAHGMRHGDFSKLNLGKLAVKKNSETEIGSNNTKELIPERFSRAIEQLGNEQMETRLGAIYALEKIARDSVSDHWTIIEVLAAFIRENAPLVEIEIDADEFSSDEDLMLKIPTDIQAALTVIGRRNSEHDPENHEIDLRYTDIRGADLTEADLVGADLTGANLADAMLYGANLAEADLSGANLQGAILYEANLQGAILYEANLLACNIRKANLSGAILYQAKLQAAMLYDANLTGAVLYQADLQGANLCDANLTGANFEGSNLKSANLIGANFHGANLIGANLESASLSTANLSEAVLYEAILLKANLSEANLSKANLKGAFLKDAILEAAKLCGADLTAVEKLQTRQIANSYGDALTRLPENIERPTSWAKETDSKK